MKHRERLPLLPRFLPRETLQRKHLNVVCSGFQRPRRQFQGVIVVLRPNRRSDGLCIRRSLRLTHESCGATERPSDYCPRGVPGHTPYSTSFAPLTSQGPGDPSMLPAWLPHHGTGCEWWARSESGKNRWPAVAPGARSPRQRQQEGNSALGCSAGSTYSESGLRGSGDDLVLKARSDVVEIVAVAGHAHNQVAVLLRLFLCRLQRLGRHHVELDVVPVHLEVRTNQLGQMA